MNDWSWQTTGKILDYPDMPEYPTMEETMSLAKHLQEYFTEMEYTHTQEPSTPGTLDMFEPTPDSNNTGY